jgi:uncharacterized coiled-coil protein SlyX
MFQREQIQRERYEQRIQALNNKINELQNTINVQQDTIGRLNKELKYKTMLLERITEYNKDANKIIEADKHNLFYRIFKKKG